MGSRLVAVLVLVATLTVACASGAKIESAATPPSVAFAETTTTTTTAPTTSTIAPNENRTWVATAKDHIHALAPSIEPDGELFVMPWFQPNPHQFGTPLTLMVTEGQPGDDWVRVQLPIKPNGQEAWVSTEDYEITPVFHRAEVNLTTQRVTVWENGEVIAETDAVVGGSSSPTPFGSYYVVSAVDDYFGEPALVLSAFSEVFDTFDGGLPVIAIHRTFNEGQESDPNVGSNGCVRIPTEVIRFLAEIVPLGTPVDFVV